MRGNRELTLADLLASTGDPPSPQSAYDEVSWTERTVEVHGPGGPRSMTVEAPDTWSDQSVAVVAGVYLAPRGETSVRAMVERVVTAIAGWTVEVGHVAEADWDRFADSLRRLVIHQRGAFNSPVWFNLGVPGRAQQAAACYLLDVDDSLDSILDWYREEGLIFQGGAGSGANLSRLRASMEPLSAGGTSSGPVSFMRGADASAGTIKSGGSTRRAAKMVVLDVDHPDIEDFIWCKALEERKARALRDAGFDMDLGGRDSYSLQYQNANNSVRVTDAFMAAVEADGEWALRARTTGEVVRRVSARQLWRQIAEAAWECGDPGVQFHSTINRGNTTPVSGGEIVTTNPCGETHLGPDQSCNLASINLPRYLDGEGRLDADALVADVRLLVCAMDAIAVMSDYPTDAIASNARRHRPLGLGFTGLGELLMRLAIPYASPESRDLAGAIAHLVTSAAWEWSAELAATAGPFDGWDVDGEAATRVLCGHADSCDEGGRGATSTATVDLWRTASRLAGEAVELARVSGLRNSQVTAIAPTGTISWLMGAATTGIEPAFALSTTKRLVDGRTVTVPLPCLADGLRRLGYDPKELKVALAALESRGDLTEAVDPEHLGVFATAVGPGALAPEAHVAMLAAVQAGTSQGVSKTVNLPSSATVEDVEDVLVSAWRSGCKAVAIYRDQSKAAQPLSSGSKTSVVAGDSSRPVRRQLPAERSATTYAIRVGTVPLYATVGWFDDGRPGEVFLRVAKAGSTLGGLLDALAVTTSLALQYGAPLDDLIRHWRGTRFEPAGPTGDPAMPMASSLVDALAQRLAIALGGDASSLAVSPGPPPSIDGGPTPAPGFDGSAPPCDCGALMVRTGTCWSCPACGASGGCG